MGNRLPSKLKQILIIAVILNLVIIIMQGFSSVKTIENSKKGLMLVGQTAISSFEGGRRARLLLDTESTTRFRSFIDNIGANTGVLSLYLFDQSGRVLFNTRDVTPPKINPAIHPDGTVETPDGLFMYHTLPPARSMMGNMMGHGHNRRFSEKTDSKVLTAGVMLNLSGHKSIIRAQITFMFGMIALEALLIAIYIYTARMLKLNNEQSRRLEASEREAELGKMSRLMAHELKNPLSTVKGLMEFSAKKAEGDLKDISESCVEELGRLDKIINDYLSYGKDMTLIIGRADIRDITDSAARLLQIDARQKGIDICITGNAEISADIEKMRQIVFNLLLNAVQGAPEDSEINIEINDKKLTIANDIKDDNFDRESLGKPFYTTKSIGTGLGLAIVKRIVQLHGFRCEIKTNQKFVVEIIYI
ncbi:integral membrane sensor signal transduction histidine kinase [Denitrovibrio acetiphilus DSM 12809]|uniref:histidine kinase n=1 Tax=Denitrovibrio acetiphilus (strain DSM 12809 / NBRC 114555 / N2460) TaxID=522772 RepID=D4H5R2_DENA2|nr:ATP-binding protein [Denitrovibrio acetiphilus]ADD69503.1 integral membrane sensor signal transduction histidine kinase [Denitrovibrio acetiphilus DSM 12809]